jgi:hypothetical protein
MRVRVGPADIYLERGDITDYEVDAIVHAANGDLSMSTGVASTIKRKGGTIVEEEAARQGPLEGGEAVVTTAGNLPANYVIHAAVMGPDHRPGAGGTQGLCRSHGRGDACPLRRGRGVQPPPHLSRPVPGRNSSGVWISARTDQGTAGQLTASAGMGLVWPLLLVCRR